MQAACNPIQLVPPNATTLCSAAHICSNQIMGWGEKAIEIRSVETGHLDGVFMHKRAQRLKFLCERNDKVSDPHPPRPGTVGRTTCKGLVMVPRSRNATTTHTLTRFHAVLNLYGSALDFSERTNHSPCSCVASTQG